MGKNNEFDPFICSEKSAWWDKVKYGRYAIEFDTQSSV